MSEKIVIVGGGQSACSCAARIRKNNASCEILLIGNEDFLPYQRPPLSKKYATGDMTRDQLLLRPHDWYEANNITYKTNVDVTKLDVNAKTVSLSDASEEHYDKLVIATGSRARRLPEAVGGNLDGVYVLRDLNDADAISAELVEGRDVVIVGGGYIGLEAAAVCASRGLNVTLIEASERILQRVACKETSDWFRNLHSSQGVKIHEGVGLKEILSVNDKANSVILEDRTEIKADFVLVGIGIIPNTELASEAGLDVDAGIVLDDYGQSSNSDVYAAGDCTSFMFREEYIRLESVQNAIDQAECVADNINGETRKYNPYPWFWSDQYNVKLQIAGLNRGYDNIVIRDGEREGSTSHFYFRGDALLAVDAMNDPRTYMVAKKMLEAGRNITPEQAADKSLVLKDLL